MEEYQFVVPLNTKFTLEILLAHSVSSYKSFGVGNHCSGAQLKRPHGGPSYLAPLIFEKFV